MKVVPLRLLPGDDLRLTLEAWMGQQSELAGCLISAVGSLSVAQLRFAGDAEATTIRGDLEDVGLADSGGRVLGGHLCAGSLVRTTAELVVGLLPNWEFRRELDPATGYDELTNCGSVFGLLGHRRKPPLHLQKHQPGHPCSDAAGPVAAQQLHDRDRDGTDAEATQQKATQLLKVRGHEQSLSFRLAGG